MNVVFLYSVVFLSHNPPEGFDDPNWHTVEEWVDAPMGWYVLELELESVPRILFFGPMETETTARELMETLK